MSKLKQHCKLSKKDFKTYASEIKELQKNPKFTCKKCGEKSNKKSFLCKPEKQ